MTQKLVAKLTDEDRRRVEAVITQYTERLWRSRGFVGARAGFPVRKGVLVREPAIIAFVRAKMDDGFLDRRKRCRSSSPASRSMSSSPTRRPNSSCGPDRRGSIRCRHRSRIRSTSGCPGIRSTSRSKSISRCSATRGRIRAGSCCATSSPAHKTASPPRSTTSTAVTSPTRSSRSASCAASRSSWRSTTASTRPRSYRSSGG